MKMRPLGQSGIEASAVAIGTWAIGGWMWGGADEKEAIEGVHAALDSGVNLLDTAPIYGFGVSEQVVGKAIADRRDQVLIATKCGMVVGGEQGRFKTRSTGRRIDEHGHIEIRIYNGPESVKQECERSLKRLGVETIDLYQTHWQEDTTRFEDTMAAMLELKQQGKIRAIGVCNATSEEMKSYGNAGPLDTDQEKFSMIDRAIEDEQLPYCRENNIAMLAYSPLAMGLLTGKVGPEREFNSGDIRASWPRFSQENRQRVADLLKAFEPVADQHEATMAQLVIAWTLHQPGLTHALCGARNRDQALDNAKAGSIDLSDEDVQTMNEAIAKAKNIE